MRVWGVPGLFYPLQRVWDLGLPLCLVLEALQRPAQRQGFLRRKQLLRLREQRFQALEAAHTRLLVAVQGGGERESELLPRGFSLAEDLSCDRY